MINVKKNVPELRFPGFNDEWEEKKLGNICKIKKGQQLSKISLNNFDKYPVINGGIRPSGYIDKYNKNENSIVISEGGASCGYVNFIKTKFWSGGHCYTLEELKNIIIVEFLYQYLKFNEKRLSNLRVGSGLPNIQQKAISSFEIMSPSLAEQQKIAAFLSAIDKKIEIVDKKIEYLESYKKGLMQKLLTGKIRFSGFNDEWKEEKLNEIFKNYNEKNKKHNYKQYTIGKNGIKLIDDIRYNISNHKTFKLNDLIIGIGINEINLNINILNGCCSPIYTIYKIDEHILNPFFGYYYIPKKIYEYRNKITKISSRRNFDIIHKDLLNLEIPFPSLQEQQKIASFLSAVDKKIELVTKKLENLKAYKKGLLQKMFV